MPMKRAKGMATPLLAAAIGLGPLAGCQNLPGSKSTQGTVLGGASGAGLGAAIADDSAAGALVGGLLGAGGGYLVGSQMDKRGDNQADVAEARQAATRARRNPATAADVAGKGTADLNGDGFVTMDEIVAMEKANLSDPQMLERLRASDQVFRLSPQQQQQLIEQGVSRDVVEQMESINRGDPAGRPPASDIVGQSR